MVGPNPEKAPFVRIVPGLPEIFQKLMSGLPYLPYFLPGLARSEIKSPHLSWKFDFRPDRGSGCSKKKVKFCPDWLLTFLQNFHKIRPDPSQASPTITRGPIKHQLYLLRSQGHLFLVSMSIDVYQQDPWNGFRTHTQIQLEIDNFLPFIWYEAITGRKTHH